MDPFEFYNFEAAIYHETGFTRIQPQGYSKLPDNIRRQGKLISKPKQESKRVPIQAAQINNPPQGEIASKNYVMLCVA